MFFVKRLREAQSIFCGKTKTPVRLALQRRQIIKLRRHRSCRSAFFRDDARLAETFRFDGFRETYTPNALLLELIVAFLLGKFFIEPAAGVFARLRAERAVDFPIVARNEFFNLLLALDEDRQRRRLHAADRCEMKTAGLGIERRHRARAVDADEPVAFAAARRRVRERNHFTVCAQVREAVADRRRRHGLQPEPLDRFVAFRVLNDVTENQFAFAPGIAGIHDRGDILALDELH